MLPPECNDTTAVHWGKLRESGASVDTMSHSDVERLLNNFELFCVFKEYMEQHHADENVTAYVWLCKIQRMSPQGREKQVRTFAGKFIGKTAPRQLNLESKTVGIVHNDLLSDEQISNILQEVTETLTLSWTEFLTSDIYDRYNAGKYTSRIVQSQAKRWKYMRRGRRESDDMVIAHFREHAQN